MGDRPEVIGRREAQARKGAALIKAVYRGEAQARQRAASGSDPDGGPDANRRERSNT